MCIRDRHSGVQAKDDVIRVLHEVVKVFVAALADIGGFQRTLEYALEHAYICEGRNENFDDLVQNADYIIFGLYPTVPVSYTHLRVGHS